jgi:hypothetical protein
VAAAHADPDAALDLGLADFVCVVGRGGWTDIVNAASSSMVVDSVLLDSARGIPVVQIDDAFPLV